MEDGPAAHAAGALMPHVRSFRLRRAAVADWEAYPFRLPAVRALEGLSLHPHVTYFVGENGSGKSTVLEALAVALGFNPEGGTPHLRFGTAETHSALHAHLVVDGRNPTKGGFFLRAESFYNVATAVDREDREIAGGYSHLLTQRLIHTFGGRSLHEQSHGESFFALFTHRFRHPGVYLLDEPEAALSPQRQMALLAELHRLVRGGCQFVIATHSPIVLAYPSARIYRFGDDGIAPVEYEDTEQVQVTRDFLLRREAMLRVLLGEES